MSDDDVELTGSALLSQRNLDRRTPRFSWNLAYEETFFSSLCESMQLGYKENHSFKAGAWERAAIALRDKHGAYPEKSHLINKADNARKKFRMWRGLREDPDFIYNPATRTVTASEDAWRKHFDKEPLSKALRGRPFEHEEFMEVLFPDVVGSGGAPKRIMKPRRRNLDGTPVTSSGRQSIGNASSISSVPPSTSSQAPIDPLLESNPNPYADTPSRQPQLANSTSTAFLGNNTNNTSSIPTSNTIPPLSMTPGSNHNALTPPDEHAPPTSSVPRKRNHPDSSTSSRAEKRRGRPSRFSVNFYENQFANTASPSQAQSQSQSQSQPQPQPQSHTPSSYTTSSFIPPPRHLSNGSSNNGPSNNTITASTRNLHPSFQPNANALSVEDGLLSLADALRARAPPKWQEQAVEILFRDFESEDADLQLKIAEKALTDENKAMVFVKMTPALRKHWVGRLREVHQRNLGGGLGRVGDEAS